MRSSRTALVAALASLALLAAACGDDDGGVAASGNPAQPAEESSTTETTAGDEEGAFPVTVSSGGADTTIESRPEAIVSLSPTATEMVFAIGAGDQVIAVDDNSNFPEGVPSTDLSGFDPNVEAVIAEEPDLVLVSADTNDIVAGLDAAGIPSIVLPAAQTIDDTYAQIEVVGAATGHVGEAAELVSQMQADIEELTGQVTERPEPLTYYHELDDTLYSVTSDTFLGQIYALAGLENIADPADPDGAAGGYPQLSPEFLIDADPDLVFLADTRCCGQNAETFGARPGFEQLRAVQQGHVVPLDDDVASRWGPRIVDLLEAVVQATAAVETAAAAG